MGKTGEAKFTLTMARIAFEKILVFYAKAKADNI